MKSLKFLLIALLFSMTASGGAWAGHGHFGGHFHGHLRHGVGVIIAAPLFYPWYAWPSPYYSPPPPVYVEQGDPASAQGGYWYRCDEPSGYHPYVKECPAGWVKVVPTPPHS